jgi:hypothetical protein
MPWASAVARAITAIALLGHWHEVDAAIVTVTIEGSAVAVLTAVDLNAGPDDPFTFSKGWYAPMAQFQFSFDTAAMPSLQREGPYFNGCRWGQYGNMDNQTGWWSEVRLDLQELVVDFQSLATVVAIEDCNAPERDLLFLGTSGPVQTTVGPGTGRFSISAIHLSPLLFTDAAWTLDAGEYVLPGWSDRVKMNGTWEAGGPWDRWGLEMEFGSHTMRVQVLPEPGTLALVVLCGLAWAGAFSVAARVRASAA